MRHLACALAGTIALAAGQGSPLDRSLIATEHLIYAPPGDLVAPSDASEMGLLSRVAAVATVPFGFESDEATPRPSTSSAVEPHLVSAATLRQALDAFVALDRRYQWRDMNGVFVVRAAAAWTDPANVLNRRVRDIHWHDLSAFSVFDRVAHLLYPNEQRDIYVGLERRNDRPFAVDVDDGTVLDVLNAAARADGELGWWVRYGLPSDARQLELTIGHYGIGPTFGWRERPPRHQR